MIDLHVHTSCSDGRLSPDEVVGEAVARGMRAIAITDHDVLDGLDAAHDAARLAGSPLEVVPGIEMTARGEGPRAVHVLGYFVDPAETRLRRALDRARSLMAGHVERVLDAVRTAGGSLDVQDLDRYRHRYAGGAALVFGMLERGVLRGAPPGSGMRLLRQAAEEPRAYTVEEAVRLIHGAGGVAVLAHPARLVRGRPLLDADELRVYVEAGMDAIEAWQWIPNGWGSQHYQKVAAELGLLVSGGSDDHGKRASDGATRLGRQPIPDSVLERLRERAVRRRAPRPA